MADADELEVGGVKVVGGPGTITTGGIRFFPPVTVKVAVAVWPVDGSVMVTSCVPLARFPPRFTTKDALPPESAAFPVCVKVPDSLTGSV